VLAVWVSDVLYTTSSATAQKGRNLDQDGRGSIAVNADDMHLVVEGNASRVVDETLINTVADAYRAKYEWPVTVVDGAFDAPYGAPTAGPPPYRPYAIVPTTVFGFVTDDALGPANTRWRF
jgi:hypothetical protein